MTGQSAIRRAALIGVIAPGFEYARFWRWGIEDQAWHGELGGFFVVSAAAGIVALVLGFALVWFIGYPLLMYVAHLVRGVVAPRVSVEIWMAVLDRALRFAPIAAALGVVTWLVYSLGNFPGWPGDVVFGTIGNLLGALVYGPLLLGWYRAARAERAAANPSGRQRLSRADDAHAHPYFTSFGFRDRLESTDLRRCVPTCFRPCSLPGRPLGSPLMLAIRCSLRLVLPLIFVAMCCGGAAEAAAPEAAVSAGGAAPRPVVLSDADWKRVVRREVSSQRLDELLSASAVKPAAVSDETFLRRVSLDVAGSLPEAESLRTFLADSDPAKRGKKIDELLASEAYARHWARYWRDVVSARLTLRRTMGLTRSFEEWLFERLRAGDDWRTIVRAILTAQGELRFTLNKPSPENGQLFFLVAHDGPEAEERAAETSRVFLGIQIQCAQCHDHPTENWKRTQFHDFAAYFARIKYEQLFDKGKLSGVQLVTLKDAEHKMQDLKNPEVFSTVQPRFLDGRAPDSKLDDLRRREALAVSVLSDENYWFAAAFVNRVWTELMGSSFYPHIDDLGPMKPVARPEVLLTLVGSFQASGYDPRALIRTIVNTEAYQRRLSNEPAGDESTAASAEVLATTSKRLRPDALWDALVHVFGKIEHGARFHTGSGVRFNSSFTEGKFRAEFDFDPSLDVDEVNGTIPQALFLMNNPVLNSHIKAERTTALGKLLREQKDDAAAVEQLYRLVLARTPTERERKRCLDFAKTAASREEAFEDLLWALINSTEFQRTR